MQVGDFFSLGAFATVVLAVFGAWKFGLRGRLAVLILAVLAYWQIVSGNADQRMLKHDVSDFKTALGEAKELARKTQEKLTEVREAQEFQKGQLSMLGERALALPTASSPSLNTYVCETAIAPAHGKGRFALLVEFGAKREATNGFVGLVHTGIPYVDTEEWFAPPLRTDVLPNPGGVFTNSFRNDRQPPQYFRAFNTPAITPKQSFYLYFEADEPMTNVSVLYLDDAFKRTDPHADELAKIYDKCPR